MGQGCNEVGETLKDLNDLDQHVKCVCEIVEEPKSDRKRQRREREMFRLLEGKCGKICIEPKFLKKN